MRLALARPSPFAGLWVSAASSSFARIAIQLALSWIAFEVSGSLFMVGVVAAVRMAPQIPLGIPAGILADWFERRTVVVTVTAVIAAVALGVAALGGAELLGLPALLAAALLFGLLDTLRTTAAQAYAYDLARSSHVARGVALVNLGSQVAATGGGLAGGYLLEALGGGATFLMIGVALALGALAPLVAAPPVRQEAAPEVEPGSSPEAPKRQRPSFRAASTLLLRHRLVAVLVLTIVLAEVLGFSSQTLFPTFARDVFHLGAAGLGMLQAARSIGGVTSLLLLSRLGTRERSGSVLLATAAVLGVALTAFAWAPRFEVALAWMVLAGAAFALLDTLSQLLLQQSVGERERGAAMGLWVFGIGFAPFGHLALGALADRIGAPPTQTLVGVGLVAVALLLSLYAPLRRMK